MPDGQLAAEVALATRALAAAGQSDLVWGHVSRRDPGGRGVWMKASGWGFEEVGPERVLLVSPEGKAMSGDGTPHLEFPILTEIMAARSDVGAVVHTHGRAATACLSRRSVATALPRRGALRRTRHSPLPLRAAGQRPLARRLARRRTRHRRRVPDARTWLGHAGGDLAEAVMYAVLLERACRTQLDALAAGGPARWSDPAAVAQKRQETWSVRQLHAGYAYLCRLTEAGGTAR
ncbi:class II aldolase/adducin family protein [Streptomyces sp. NPDC058001]|uniref:class II aldolase/adducin family protein n=1 Tax=Streptomyces sp. NPDC058001 TaxID=3346300 RepID=UPI0036ED1CE0